MGRRFFVVALFALLIPLALVGTLTVLSPPAQGAATNATRIPWGIFFAGRTSNPLPSPQPGMWGSSLGDAGTVLQVCAQGGAGANGTCYPIASPLPAAAVAGSADAGSSLGSGAAVKLDTCSTGGSGSTCYTLKQVVGILKTTGQLAP